MKENTFMGNPVFLFILALRVKDLGEAEIRICQNLQETARSGIIINPPKTKAGHRCVPRLRKSHTVIFTSYGTRTPQIF